MLVISGSVGQEPAANNNSTCQLIIRQVTTLSTTVVVMVTQVAPYRVSRDAHIGFKGRGIEKSVN